MEPPVFLLCVFSLFLIRGHCIAIDSNENNEDRKEQVRFRSEIKIQLQTLVKETNKLLEVKTVQTIAIPDTRDLLKKSMGKIDALTKNNEELSEVLKEMKVAQKYTLSRVEKANARNTPVSEQHSERALSAVTSSIGGIATIKGGVESDDPAAIMQGITSIIGGILAVIPSPKTKALAVFFEMISGLLAVFGGKAAPTVEDYIKAMGDKIISEIDVTKKANARGAEDTLRFYYKSIIGITGRQTKEAWMIHEPQLPRADIGISELAVLDVHIKHLMKEARGFNAFNLILLYAKIAYIRIQIQLKFEEIWPKETKAHRFWQKQKGIERRTFEKDTVDYLQRILYTIDPTTIMTLQYFHPPGFDQNSKELTDEVFKMTFQEEKYDVTGEPDGEVFEFGDPPEVPDGTYLIETAVTSRAGHYIHTTIDWGSVEGSDFWNQYLKQLPKDTKCSMRWVEAGGSRGGSTRKKEEFGCNKTPQWYKLGRKVSLFQKDTKNSKIKIETYKQEPNSKLKTMTFEADNGKLTFFAAGRDNHGQLKIKNTIETVEVFSVSKDHPIDSAIVSLITHNKFRLIPLGGTEGDTIKVVIGQPDGPYFLYYDGSWHNCYGGDLGCTNTYQYALYMKELTSDEENKVNDGFIWTLKRQSA